MGRLIGFAMASLDRYVADADGRFDRAMPDEAVHRRRQAVAATSPLIAGTTSATARERNETGAVVVARSRTGVAASR